MKIDLYKLYQYIFGDWANLEKQEEIKVSLDEKTKVNIKINKRKVIQNFFFADLIKDKNKFRAVLRSIKNPHPLEQVLYDNVTDNLNENYSLPDDKEVQDHFNNYDKKYHYFSEIKDTKNVLKKFKELFIICKIVGDVIEDNNDENNTIAALHAYKILVIFGDFPQFHKYLNSFNFFSSDHPIHDALIYPIPEYTPKLHLPEWRKLILQSGPQALLIFKNSLAIEEYLKGPPKNLLDALEAAKKTNYKKADIYPELANLCNQYNIDEEIFNKCLEIDKNRKSADHLPNEIIHGIVKDQDADIETSNYYLTKLPISDPRAYLLGHITNCCQSIGGHSEACVIDGLTRSHNGFYVLLKEKKSKDQKSISTVPIDDKGNIDYERAEIVGQGYAWLSDEGNLTFDSWENKTPKRDDRIIVSMLEKFAQKVTLNEQSNILRVTIGTGGKTPDLLIQNKVENPEVMYEGYQYNDSIEQSLIYCNEDKRKIFVQELEKKLKSILTDNEDKTHSATNIINWVAQSCYSKIYYDRTMRLLDLKETQVFLQTNLAISQKDVLAFRWKSIATVFENLSVNELTAKAYSILNKMKLQYNLKYINYLGSVITSPEKLDNYIKILSKVHELKMDNHARNKIFKIMTRLNDNLLVKPFLKVLDRLKSFQLENDTTVIDRIVYLFSHCKKPDEFDNYFVICNRIKEMNLENDKDICRRIIYRLDVLHYSIGEDTYGRDLLDAISHLRQVKLDKEPLLRALVLHAPSIEISYYLDVFNKVKAMKLENDETICKSILEHPREALQLLNSIKKMEELKLENYSEVRKCMLRYPEYSERLVNSFAELNKSDLGDNNQILQHILKYPQHSWNIIECQKQLVNLNLQNDIEIKHIIDKYPHYAKDIASTFMCLKDLNLETDLDVRNKIFQHSNREEIYEAFSILKSSNIVMNNAILKELLEYPLVVGVRSKAREIAASISSSANLSGTGLFKPIQSTTDDSVPNIDEKNKPKSS